MRPGRRPALASSLVAIALGLSGCAGLARGITEGLMARQGPESIDTKQCLVRGPAFEGLESSMQRQEEIAKTDTLEPRSSLKVLMVHGIGDHIPGYSTRLAENLARGLRLTRTERRFKEISLTLAEMPGAHLGLLRVTRFLDAEGAREMLFYELTWDSIVEEEKQSLAFDSSSESSFRGA